MSADGETGGNSYFQFVFGVELKKHHYLKELEGRGHMVEEVYLVERNSVVKDRDTILV